MAFILVATASLMMVLAFLSLRLMKQRNKLNDEFDVEKEKTEQLQKRMSRRMLDPQERFGFEAFQALKAGIFRQGYTTEVLSPQMPEVPFRIYIFRIENDRCWSPVVDIRIVFYEKLPVEILFRDVVGHLQSTLRYGEEVITNRAWIEDILVPAVNEHLASLAQGKLTA